MRLYTRTGDKGDTGLSAPGRVRKSAPRIEALGDLDEANAAIGAARALIAAKKPGAVVNLACPCGEACDPPQRVWMRLSDEPQKPARDKSATDAGGEVPP